MWLMRSEAMYITENVTAAPRMQGLVSVQTATKNRQKNGEVNIKRNGWRIYGSC